VLAGGSRILRTVGKQAWQTLALGLWLALPPAALADGEQARELAGQGRFDTVVIDAGHGGEDEGARGVSGLLEKDLVLEVSRALAAQLRKAGLRVVMTRERDVFVPLEQRTNLANDARADLFVSVHANAARDGGARGSETYFMSLEASDEHAHGVALRENESFSGKSSAAGAEADPREPAYIQNVRQVWICQPAVALIGKGRKRDRRVDGHDWSACHEVAMRIEQTLPRFGYG